MRKLLGAAAVAAMMLVAAPAAFATTQTAASGNVSATFSFSGKAPNYKHLKLAITRRGQQLYSEPVTSSACGHLCWPGSTEAKFPSVQVLDLEHDGEPDVVLTLFSGGAHCCSVAQIFRYDPATMAYVKFERNFRDPGFQVKDLAGDGHFEFESANDAFAYEFTAFAASGMPIQIFTFSAGKFIDVTRSYPKLIRSDAALWLRLFKRNIGHGDGVLAAWAADEDMLGNSAKVKRYLLQQLRLHHLGNPGGPSGRRFVSALQRFLRQQGYLK
jgi:hypothetical protein